MTARERVKQLIKAFPKVYPNAHCELDFRNPLELLVATILSAQCTDKRVNMVTPALFKKYRTARDYANAPQAEFENAIKSTGFYRSKTKSIRGAMRAIAEEHGGKVPDTMEELCALPGVGRKTANVVLGSVDVARRTSIVVLGSLAHAPELCFELLKLLIGKVLEIDEFIARVFDRANEFVQFQMNCFCIAVLRVLNQKDHEKGDDCGGRV